jgi:hypothetical protein
LHPFAAVELYRHERVEMESVCRGVGMAVGTAIGASPGHFANDGIDKGFAKHAQDKVLQEVTHVAIEDKSLV